VLARRERAELRLDRAVDILNLNAEQRRLLAIDNGAKLLRVRAVGGGEARELPSSPRRLEGILRHLIELRGVAGFGVLDPKFEAAGRADAGNRRRRYRIDDRLFDGLRFVINIEEHRARVLRLCRFKGAIALFEILERDEERARVGFEAAVQETVARDHR